MREEQAAQCMPPMARSTVVRDGSGVSSLKPRPATFSAMASRLTCPWSKETRRDSSARLTAMSVTPGMRPTTRSMREEQAAQCMPETGAWMVVGLGAGLFIRE